MPFMQINGANIHYEDSDPYDQHKPVMVFAHGLLWSARIYDEQVAHFSAHYRCITFDFRGQGQSQITKTGYDMDSLTNDTEALLEALGIEQYHFVGLSMGGFVAQRLAIRHPDRILSLVLIATSADPEDVNNAPKYMKLVNAIRWLGMKRVSKKVLPIMFGEQFLTDKGRKDECKAWLEQLQANHKLGTTRAALGVIEREGVYEKISKITAPTLVIVGDQDVATPYPKAERMHFAISGSKLSVLKGAGHTATIETPEKINTAISQFLITCL